MTELLAIQVGYVRSFTCERSVIPDFVFAAIIRKFG
jgi:hypothetical protein